FMTGGLLGFASGGVVSTALVSRFGLPGLYLLIFCPVLGVLMVVLLRIRLAVEPASARASQPAPTKTGPPFRLIMIMAMPAGVSTTLIALLLPTRLEELGFKLTFGGYSATMFGLGGALGSFVWAAVAHRKGELLCSTLAFLLTGPFALAYLLLINNNWAVWIIFAAGFCAFAAYILLITLARYAPGANLGQRMSWIVGGTWLFASVVFFLLVPIAERFGTHLVLQYVPLGYLLSGLLGLHIMLRKRGKTSLNQS
ncbi:MAG: MFS transporter, partial [Planctomycetes bacterium]|nr:MFS transporter [Planctomycetota bacterium]